MDEDYEYDFEKFFDYSLDMFCISTLKDGSVVRINSSFQRVLGWPRERLLGLGPFDLLHPEDIEPTLKEIEKLKQGVPVLSFQNRYRSSNGTYKHFSWTIFPDPKAGLLYAIARDVTKRIDSNRRIRQLAAKLKKANYQLFEQASTDPLTKLKNRRSFNEELNYLVNLTRKQKDSLSLLMIDVDHFKDYNDRFGHPAGDRALIDLASLLAKTIRESDILARYGGEEFVVALPDTPEAEAIEVAEKLVKTIRDFQWIGMSLTISVGVATSDFDSSEQQVRIEDDSTSLIENADQALYQSKVNGRNRVTHRSQIH
ncbi:sensor domain-containing diguanylate cyclase [Leptospira alstonii]|uniref:sensor domain-containing diguanylate cyclase n=1 Tax=Leptospira alstonii TaxID=28452 RepID=UPI0007733973|nr:sensor domain-containing diguanylate cyclase [Leptospira alstonii]